MLVTLDRVPLPLTRIFPMKYRTGRRTVVSFSQFPRGGLLRMRLVRRRGRKLVATTRGRKLARVPNVWRGSLNVIRWTSARSSACLNADRASSSRAAGSGHLAAEPMYQKKSRPLV
jgi:hypothetical protein